MAVFALVVPRFADIIVVKPAIKSKFVAVVSLVWRLAEE